MFLHILQLEAPTIISTIFVEQTALGARDSVSLGSGRQICLLSHRIKAVSPPGQGSGGFACRHYKRFASLNSCSPAFMSHEAKSLCAASVWDTSHHPPWEWRGKRKLTHWHKHETCAARYVAQVINFMVPSPGTHETAPGSHVSLEGGKSLRPLTVLHNYLLKQFILWFHMCLYYSQLTGKVPAF